MIKLADRLHCTGCASCVQSCHHNALSMRYDDEGFLQPQIDSARCIECELCMKRCPELNLIKKINYQHQAFYAFINDTDRKRSSSGGAFSAFAKWILQQKGIVFGVTMDEDFDVKYVSIESVEELGKLQGSKYVQSNIGNTYKYVKNNLDKNRKVLFVGTGCQVGGLYAYLNGRRYEGLLYTLDLICHGTPSIGTFHSYLNKLTQSISPHGELGEINKFHFRKFDSWSIIPSVKFEKSRWKVLNLSENAYMNAFFKGLIFRESCFNCRYCNTERVGTFTIADFWGIGRHGVKFKRNIASGVSLVIDNMGLIPTIIKELQQFTYIEKRSREEAMYEQINLKAPMKRQSYRDTAVKDLINPSISLLDFSVKYSLPYKKTAIWYIQKAIKDTICVFGLYNIYKTIIYKIGK